MLFYEGVLLMEVIGDHEGRVAPRLVDAGLSQEHALPLYEQLRGEVIKMLAADYIHGDLSEFNILLGVNGPVIIDFPQTVAAARNSRSEPFFRRDLGNLVRFFSGLDPAVQKRQSDIDEIWRAYVRRELTPDFVPTGRTFQQPKQERGPFERPRGGPGRDGRPPGGRGNSSAQGQAREAGPRDRRPGAPEGRTGQPGSQAMSRPGNGGPSRDAPRGGPGGPRDSRPGGGPRGGGGGQKRGPEVSYRGASQGPPRATQGPPGADASRQNRTDGPGAQRSNHPGERPHGGRPPHHRRHR
ncbi:MAG: hypothetical protein MUC96_38140 [Myxococcaceae bacterium]|nr:hypothetical protein [Myxococcaceae bacterium]